MFQHMFVPVLVILLMEGLQCGSVTTWGNKLFPFKRIGKTRIAQPDWTFTLSIIYLVLSAFPSGWALLKEFVFCKNVNFMYLFQVCEDLVFFILFYLFFIVIIYVLLFLSKKDSRVVKNNWSY